MINTCYHIPLSERNLLSVTGQDSLTFLQALVTVDLTNLPLYRLNPSALLTPQGKILAAFLIARTPEGFLIETHAQLTQSLTARLALYKLRSQVEISILPISALSVVLSPTTKQFDLNPYFLQDTRFNQGNISYYHCYGPLPESSALASVEVWQRQRLEAGIAEILDDYPPLKCFPHDINLDLISGVSFQKGCYVGQEVVARMQHKTIPQRRLVRLKTTQPLPYGHQVLLANEKEVGWVQIYAPSQALAIVRLDKIAKARQEGQVIRCCDQAVQLSAPPYANFSLEDETDVSAK